MNPSRCIIIGQQLIQPNTLGLTQSFDDEIFITAIMYDLTTLPYYISNYGRIWSIRYERLLSLKTDRRGYYRTNITIAPNKTVFTGVHKLELMSFEPILEAANNLYIPDHIDGNPGNNYIGNLERVTVSENTRRVIDNGLSNCKGQNNARSYITDAQVHEICKLLEKRLTSPQIADVIAGTNIELRKKLPGLIGLIRRGETYLDISSYYNIPGLKGRRRYAPEDAYRICSILCSGVYDVVQVCDMCNISLDDRKLFIVFIRDIVKGKAYRYILKKFPYIYKPLPIPFNTANIEYYL